MADSRIVLSGNETEVTEAPLQQVLGRDFANGGLIGSRRRHGSIRTVSPDIDKRNVQLSAAIRQASRYSGDDAVVGLLRQFFHAGAPHRDRRSLAELGLRQHLLQEDAPLLSRVHQVDLDLGKARREDVSVVRLVETPGRVQAVGAHEVGAGVELVRFTAAAPCGLGLVEPSRLHELVGFLDARDVDLRRDRGRAQREEGQEAKSEAHGGGLALAEAGAPTWVSQVT